MLFSCFCKRNTLFTSWEIHKEKKSNLYQWVRYFPYQRYWFKYWLHCWRVISLRASDTHCQVTCVLCTNKNAISGTVIFSAWFWLSEFCSSEAVALSKTEDLFSCKCQCALLDVNSLQSGPKQTNIKNCTQRLCPARPSSFQSFSKGFRLCETEVSLFSNRKGAAAEPVTACQGRSQAGHCLFLTRLYSGFPDGLLTPIMVTVINTATGHGTKQQPTRRVSSPLCKVPTQEKKKKKSEEHPTPSPSPSPSPFPSPSPSPSITPSLQTWQFMAPEPCIHKAADTAKGFHWCKAP